MCEDKNGAVREIHRRLYECRNLEIHNLWQRSIFLAAFLVLCFTGYGALIGKMIDHDLDNMDYPNIIAIFISLVGIILSILWIAMAKGSKAWYEVYEKAIITFENGHSYELGLPSENRMGNYGVPTKDLNPCLFSTAAGAYSPSKINIVIGQISLIIWATVAIAHFICCFVSFPCCKTIAIIGGVVLLIVIICLFFQTIQCKCIFSIKSGHLSQQFDKNGIRETE